MHQEASDIDDLDLDLFSYPSRALTIQHRSEKTLSCQGCEESEEKHSNATVKDTEDRSGQSVSDMCRQCQSLGVMGPQCLGAKNKGLHIQNVREKEYLDLKNKGLLCQDMRSRGQQSLCLGDKDLQCQCLIGDLQCRGLRNTESKYKCIGNRDRPSKMNKEPPCQGQRKKDLNMGPEYQDLDDKGPECKKDWKLETMKYSDLLLKDKGPWDLWRDLDNENDKSNQNKDNSQNLQQKENSIQHFDSKEGASLKGQENNVSHTINSSRCAEDNREENQGPDSHFKGLNEKGQGIKNITDEPFFQTREDENCQDTKHTFDKQQVPQKPFHIPTSCSLGSLYVHNNNDDSSCATVGMGCTQTGASNKGPPKANMATDIHNWQSGFTGCLDRVPNSSGGWATGLQQQGSREKVAGPCRPTSQSAQLLCTRNSNLLQRQDLNSGGSKCLRYLSHRYIPPLPKSHSFTFSRKPTQEQPSDSIKLPNHTCVDDSDDDEASISLSFIRPVPSRRPLCRTTSLYNTSTSMCTMPSVSYTYQTLSNVQDDHRTPQRPRSFHEASRCSNLDYHTQGASSRPQSSQRRYECTSKSKSSPCKADGKCSKIMGNERGTSSPAANPHGSIKYTTDKLCARTREDLNVLLEHFYKQTQAVSEELVVLLQVRHDLREQVDMRRIAIEQLLRIHTHDGDNPPSIHMGVLLPSPGSCSTQSSSSS